MFKPVWIIGQKNGVVAQRQLMATSTVEFKKTPAILKVTSLAPGPEKRMTTSVKRHTEKAQALVKRVSKVYTLSEGISVWYLHGQAKGRIYSHCSQTQHNRQTLPIQWESVFILHTEEVASKAQDYKILSSVNAGMRLDKPVPTEDVG